MSDIKQCLLTKRVINISQCHIYTAIIFFTDNIDVTRTNGTKALETTIYLFTTNKNNSVQMIKKDSNYHSKPVTKGVGSERLDNFVPGTEGYFLHLVPIPRFLDCDYAI